MACTPEMDLLQEAYASSSEESDSSESEQAERLPQIPSQVLDKFHITPSAPKDTMIKPSFKSWVTFAYLEWRLTRQERVRLDRVVSKCNSIIKQHTGGKFTFRPTYWSELGSPSPLHVSLTSNITFAKPEIRDAFLSRVESSIDESDLAPFQVKLDNQPLVIRSLANRGNFFLILNLEASLKQGHVGELTELLASEYRRLEGKAFYKIVPSLCHVSIGSLVAKPGTFDPVTLNKVLQQCIEPEDLSLGFKATCIKLDRNRESLSVRFPGVQSKLD